MRVGIFLVNRLPPTEGGAFSYYDRLIHAIDNHPFDPKLEICFVGREPEAKIGLKKKYVKLAPYFLHRLFTMLNRLGLLPYLLYITRINFDLSNRLDKNILKKNGIDVLFYPKQIFQHVDHFPFISMNWDIGHKSTYAFPELIYNRNFKVRESWYQWSLQQALAVFVESEHGKQELSHYCAMPLMKFHVIPMFPGRVVELNVGEAEQREILNALSLTAGSYFYYPAQYWAHKNHYNLLVAFKQLRDGQTRNLKLVFTGADFGNKAYVASVIAELGLNDSVMMLNFVTNEALYTLYKQSIGLVMPTFLGPTNMPLLEARSLGVPVICTDFDGHREMCGDGALYITPDQPETIAEAMQSLLDKNVREALLARAQAFGGQSQFTLQHAVEAIDQALVRIRPVRKTFGN